MKNDVKEYEMTTCASSAGVYCGTYKKYNEGSLYGMWIDLGEFLDAEDFFEVCRKLHDDEDDPELMFQDFQGFPRELYHESMSEDDVQKILDYLALDDDDKEVMEAYMAIHGGSVEDFADLVDTAKEALAGSGYDRFKDFADERAEEMMEQCKAACRHSYDCKGAAEMVEELCRYFDYEAYEREIKYDYDFYNGFVFYSR